MSENTFPIVALDIESDGTHPGRKAWEVGMIRREPDGTEAEIQFFVEIDLSTADPFGLRVGGFYERHPLGRRLSATLYPGDRATAAGPDLLDTPVFDGTILNRQAAAMRVARWTHGAMVIGAVPNFDTETLAPLLREHGLLPGWKHRLRCVETLTAGYLGREVGGLSDCAAALGIEHVDKHQALSDARTALAIWDLIIGGGSASEVARLRFDLQHQTDVAAELRKHVEVAERRASKAALTVGGAK